jgi:transposase
MRVTKICRQLTGVEALYANEMAVTPSGVVLAVRPRWRKPRCGGCGRCGPRCDRRGERYWRHIALGATVLWLCYAPWRVDCRHCGVTVEQVPWARHARRFTRGLEELVAYLARTMDFTAIARLQGLGWRSIARIVERVVAERIRDARLSGLRAIGLDEFSYRKRHRYLTVVVDHDRGEVVWAAKGRGADALAQLFEHRGEDGCAAIEAVTMDMAGGYKKALREHLSHVRVVFDRFHVQRLASDAVDAVRRSEVRGAEDQATARVSKRSRYALLKSPWNMSRGEHHKLADIQVNNKRLFRARLPGDTLADALAYRQPKRAGEALEQWLAWASRSKLQAFVRLARTIRTHKPGILAYINDRLTNDSLEGINNRLRTIARRAYGFHSAESLISRLFLGAGGIELDPPLPITETSKDASFCGGVGAPAPAARRA